jgi:TPR repeat protein
MRRAPLETDVNRYLAVLDGACTAGNAAECFTAGRVIQDSPVLPGNEKRAKASFARGCQLGDVISCLNAENAQQQTDWPALRTKLDRACTDGDGRACGALGGLRLAIENDRDDFIAFSLRSAELIEKSCLAGTGSDCMLAALSLNTPALHIPGERILTVLRRGCDLGDGPSCFGEANMKGSSNDPDEVTKLALWRKACELQHPDACYAVAMTSGDLPGFVHAVDLATAKCEVGDSDACEVVATTLATDQLTPAQVAAVGKLSQQACDRHMLNVCYMISRALEKGPDERRDPARSTKLQTDACSAGWVPACKN